MIESPTSNGVLVSIPQRFGHYTAKRVIGQGSTCIVVSALDRTSDKDVAVKIMPLADLQRRGILPAIQREIAVLRRLSHAHIIRFHDSFEQSGYLFVVTEHCVGGELLSWILDGRTTGDLKRLMFEIGTAVQYLHGEGIAHNDIKPENVVLDATGGVKLVDFGSAKQSLLAGDDEKSGTLIYAAPELLVDGVYHTQKADIWSLAIVFYSMATCESPYTATDNAVLFKQVEHGRLTYKRGMDMEVERLVRAMTMMNPNERPTMDTIMQDTFFDDICLPLGTKWVATGELADIDEIAMD